MSRVTPAGHHVSGAVDVDLGYVAERAAASASRAGEQLDRLVAHARAVTDHLGAGSPSAGLAWHSAAIQARLVARLRATAIERRVTAGLAPPPDPDDLAVWRTLAQRRYTIHGVGGMDGQAAATLLGGLLDLEVEQTADTVTHLYIAPVDPDGDLYVSKGVHALRVTSVPPPDGAPCVRIRRTR